MRADIKQRWVEKLQSGEIPQTKDVLGKADGSRCCLGVLCDIAVDDGLISPPYVGPGDSLVYGFNRDTGVLPEIVREWAELATPSGGYAEDDQTFYGSSLANDNDSGKTFAEIAQIIQEKF